MDGLERSKTGKDGREDWKWREVDKFELRSIVRTDGMRLGWDV